MTNFIVALSYHPSPVQLIPLRSNKWRVTAHVQLTAAVQKPPCLPLLHSIVPAKSPQPGKCLIAPSHTVSWRSVGSWRGKLSRLCGAARRSDGQPGSAAARHLSFFVAPEGTSARCHTHPAGNDAINAFLPAVIDIGGPPSSSIRLQAAAMVTVTRQRRSAGQQITPRSMSQTVFKIHTAPVILLTDSTVAAYRVPTDRPTRRPPVQIPTT